MTETADTDDLREAIREYLAASGPASVGDVATAIVADRLAHCDECERPLSRYEAGALRRRVSEEMATLVDRNEIYPTPGWEYEIND